MSSVPGRSSTVAKAHLLSRPFRRLLSAINKKYGGQIASDNSVRVTRCIDKNSSAELSEAINSMFRWYAESRLCVAYLNDITGTPEGLAAEFRASLWFCRGWTLQELLAPGNLRFYNKDWVAIGAKADLHTLISDTTGIDARVVAGASWERTSIATRMKWAARRVTTRVEDMAYCLLGIFDVNMPLLYGEGEKAFVRLQQAIMARFNDHSIFLWSPSTSSGATLLQHLATHPSLFSDVPPHDLFEESYKPTFLTNRWIELSMRLVPGSTYSLTHHSTVMRPIFSRKSMFFGIVAIAYVDMAAFYLALPLMKISLNGSEVFLRIRLAPILLDINGASNPMEPQKVFLANMEIIDDLSRISLEGKGLRSIGINCPEPLKIVSILPRDEGALRAMKYNSCTDLVILTLQDHRSYVNEQIYLFLQHGFGVKVASSSTNAIPACIAKLENERLPFPDGYLPPLDGWNPVSFSCMFGLPSGQRVLFPPEVGVATGRERMTKDTVGDNPVNGREAYFSLGGRVYATKLLCIRLSFGWAGICYIKELEPTATRRIKTREAHGLKWFLDGNQKRGGTAF